jgi:hypothetical protein
MMKRFCCTIGTLTYVTAIGTSYAAPLCDQLKSVIANSTKIDDLAGDAISDGTWQAKIAIAGFKVCEIEKLSDGDLIYVCRGEKMQSQPVAIKQYSQIKGMISSCLSGWNMTEMPGLVGNSLFFLDGNGHSGNIATQKNFVPIFNPDGTMKTVNVYIPTITVYQQKEKK